MSKTILIYITATLRHKYNELFEQISFNDTIIPLFIYDEKYFSNMSDMRKEFIYTAVEDFKTQLKKYSTILLHTQLGTPQTILQQYLTEYSIDEVRTEFQFSSDETRLNSWIKEYCESNSIIFKQIHTQTILNTATLPIKIEDIPNTYTVFRKIVEKHNCYNTQLPKQIISNAKSIKQTNLITREDLSLPKNQIHLRYIATRERALEHLKNYIFEEQHIKTYKKTRNQMLGESFSTKFSPFLNFGTLNVKEILQKINLYEKSYVSNSSTYWVKFELLWREYCKWIALKFGKKVFLKTGIMNKNVYSNFNKVYYDAFISAQTGFPLVDAGVRELITTGYMSNRARQNVSSFFVKNLHLPWLLGAQFFQRHLLDFDPCSNYLNWQYIAGCGTDSREFRYFNIYKQTNEYDKNREYISYWLPKYASNTYNEEIIDFYKSIEIAKKEQEK